MEIATEKKEQMEQKIFYIIMAKNFTKLKIDNKSKLQQAQRTLRKINTKKAIPRHIILTLYKTKNKEKKTERS